jgi:hypothetical protein
MKAFNGEIRVRRDCWVYQRKTSGLRFRDTVRVRLRVRFTVRVGVGVMKAKA